VHKYVAPVVEEANMCWRNRRKPRTSMTLSCDAQWRTRSCLYLIIKVGVGLFWVRPSLFVNEMQMKKFIQLVVLALIVLLEGESQYIPRILIRSFNVGTLMPIVGALGYRSGHFVAINSGTSDIL
jgi:hypothetical protein